MFHIPHLLVTELHYDVGFRFVSAAVSEIHVLNLNKEEKKNFNLVTFPNFTSYILTIST